MRAEHIKKFGYLAVIAAAVGIVWSGVVIVNTNTGATDLGGGPELIKLVSNDSPPTPTPTCTAGDTGFLNPTAEVFDTGGDGDGFELSPTNAFTDDGQVAVNQSGPGDRHRYYNYGFSISADCVIKGIEVRLDWFLGGTAGISSMSVELSHDGGTTWTTAKTDTQETSTEHTAVLGSSTDLWGRTWTSSEFSNANFRARVISNSDKNAKDFFLEWVPVKVHYGP